MRNCILILLLLVVFSSCQRAANKKVNGYRLVRVANYDVDGDGSSTLTSATNYKYKKGDGYLLRKEQIGIACDTLYDYLDINHDGKLELYRKEVSSHNANGMVDTTWSYDYESDSLQLQDITTYRYRNDTAQWVMHRYLDVRRQGTTLKLSVIDSLHYEGDEVVAKYIYYLIDDEEDTSDNIIKQYGQVNLETTTYKNGKALTIEKFYVPSSMVELNGKMPVSKQKRFVYDNNEHLLTANSYLLYKDGTEELWDSVSSTYNTAGQELESYVLYRGLLIYDDAMGWRQKMTYNDKGQLVTKLFYNIGRPIVKRKEVEEVILEYDDSGRVNREETIYYTDTTLQKIISKQVTDITYTPFGEKEEERTYAILEDNSWNKRILMSRKYYTYEAY